MGKNVTNKKNYDDRVKEEEAEKVRVKAQQA